MQTHGLKETDIYIYIMYMYKCINTLIHMFDLFFCVHGVVLFVGSVSDSAPWRMRVLVESLQLIQLTFNADGKIYGYTIYIQHRNIFIYLKICEIIYIYGYCMCIYIYIHMMCLRSLYIYIAILMCGLCGVLWKIIEKYEQSSPMYGNFELKKNIINHEVSRYLVVRRTHCCKHSPRRQGSTPFVSRSFLRNTYVTSPWRHG